MLINKKLAFVTKLPNCYNAQMVNKNVVSYAKTALNSPPPNPIESKLHKPGSVSLLGKLQSLLKKISNNHRVLM